MNFVKLQHRCFYWMRSYDEAPSHGRDIVEGAPGVTPSGRRGRDGFNENIHNSSIIIIGNFANDR